MKKYLLLLCFVSMLKLTAQETSKTFTIYFDHDSYELSEKAKTLLDSVALYTTQLSGTYVSTIGYTDPSGTFDYNRILAANRANAAKGYLEAKGFEVLRMGGNIPVADEPKTPEKQRRTVITVKGNGIAQSAPGGFEQQEFKGPEGTIVVASVAKGSAGAVTVSEFFSPKKMIENGMYAVDVDDNILRTAGMIEVCSDAQEANPDGKPLTVKIPIADKGTIVMKINVWVAELENGAVRWRSTPIDLTMDTEKKYYVFEVPVPPGSCLKINLDMSCTAANNCKIIHVMTHEPYDFFDIGIADEKESLTFAAKVNDTLWAFTTTADVKPNSMVFTGMFKDRDGNQKTIQMPLMKMKYTSGKYGLAHCFHITKKVRPLEDQGKGFWAWLRRQFGGE